MTDTQAPGAQTPEPQSAGALVAGAQTLDSDPPESKLARRVGVLTDIATIARRAVRSLSREPEFLAPALVIPVFFFVVNVGALEQFVEGVAAFDYREFQLPVAIIFAVTGISRASVLVVDIQSGYLDRMLITPVRRSTLLFGMMIADVVLALSLATMVLIMGFAFGVRFDTGIGGIAAFLLLSVAWSLSFTGFPYTVALRTGNPAAVNSAFLIFFPFAFLTPAFLPREAMGGWLKAVAAWNPVTYLLEGMRSLFDPGWDWAALGKGAAAIAGLGVVTFAMTFQALHKRVKTS